VEDPVKAAATRERGPSVARRLDGDETEAIIGCVMVRLGCPGLGHEADQGGETGSAGMRVGRGLVSRAASQRSQAGQTVRSDAQRRIDDLAV
jgi:hypothetical protein